MGSAYLTEILSSEGDFPTDVSSQTKQIMQQTNLLKTHIKTTIIEEKIKLEQLLNNNASLTSEANDLIEKMLKLQEEINSATKSELSNCENELNKLSSSLQEINMTMFFFIQLSDLYTFVYHAEEKLKNKEFFECARLVKKYRNIIGNGETDLRFIDLYKTLSTDGTKCYDKLLVDMNAVWPLYIQFDVELLKEIKLSKFLIHLDSVDVITDIMKASHCLGYTTFENDFIHKFLSCVANEIIMHKVVVKELTYGNKILNLEVLHNIKRPTTAEVFTNLRKSLNFLKEYLNLEIGNDCKFIDKIGPRIGAELVTVLIRSYLIRLIPTSTVELEKYDEILQSAYDFDAYLKENGFLHQDSTQILEHARSKNELFVDKFCLTYLDKIRLIIKKDLNKTMYSDDIVITALDKLPEKCVNIVRSKFKIKESCYVYPKIQISKPAKEVTDLVTQVMLEAMRSKDSFSVPIFNTILNVFEVYSAVVPLHNKKFLETIPLQAALFHNNCLYFAYFLINLAAEFYDRVSPVLRGYIHKLLEGAVLMRSLAKEKFEEHVTFQRDNLVNIMQNSAILDEDAKPSPNSELSVRQFVRQLQLLETTWKNLLPVRVYHRAMGFLLDSAIDEVIALILAVEDIPCSTAAELVTMFSIVLEKAPPLFLEPKEVFQHSTNWLKFNEFVLLLKGGLRDVDERWSDGKGPLAREFTPEQVKHLVRALFQNSERRSELLNRIK